MYKLAVLDLDGTTLDQKGKVRKRTIQMIQQLQKQGIPVSICTGRNLRNTLPIVKKLNLQSPFLCIDGTVMYTPNGTPLHTQELSVSEFHEILEVVKNEEVYIEVVAGKNYYKYIKNKKLKKYDFWSGSIVFHKIKKLMTGRRYVKRLEEITDKLQKEIYQVIVAGEEKVLKQIKRKINTHCGSDIEVRDQLWGEYLFIHKKGICKAAGVEKLCSYFNVSIDEVVAIGDEKNDIDMLKAVGMGIAMGNGVDEVKSVANDITLTNEEDGVAHALEHYFIKKSKNEYLKDNKMQEMI